LTLLAAVVLPTPAFADDGPAPAQDPQAVSCLTPKGTVDGLSIRGVLLVNQGTKH